MANLPDIGVAQKFPVVLPEKHAIEACSEQPEDFPSTII
jgi:hypothetical protein